MSTCLSWMAGPSWHGLTLSSATEVVSPSASRAPWGRARACGAWNHTERHWLDQPCIWAICVGIFFEKNNTRSWQLMGSPSSQNIPSDPISRAPFPQRSRAEASNSLLSLETANFVQLKISCCFSADILWRRNWVNWVSLTMLVSVQIPLPVTLHTAHQPNVRAEIHTASFTELREADDERCYVAGTAASPRRDMKPDWTSDYCHVSPSTKGVVEVESTENLNWANWSVVQSCKIP